MGIEHKLSQEGADERSTYDASQIINWLYTAKQRDVNFALPHEVFDVGGRIDEKPSCFVKLDIHRDIKRTLLVARALKEIDLRAIFFMMPYHEINRKFYHSPQTWDVLTEISESGHEIGLHCDVAETILEHDCLYEGINAQLEDFANRGIRVRYGNSHGNTKLKAAGVRSADFFSSGGGEESSSQVNVDTIPQDLRKVMSHFGGYSTKLVSEKCGIDFWTDATILFKGVKASDSIYISDNSRSITIGGKGIVSEKFFLSESFVADSIEVMAKNDALILLHPQWIDFGADKENIVKTKHTAPITQKREIDFSRWSDSPTEFGSVEEFESDFAFSSGAFSIDQGELSLDCLLRAEAGDTLFVFFNGAANKSVKTYPIFSWVAQSKSMCDGPCLFISDPTLKLSEDLHLAWYLGTVTFNAQQAIERLIRRVMLASGASRVVFIGTSGGGYPAIFYTFLFSNSVAYVNAPATTVKNHPSRRTVGLYEAFGLGGGELRDVAGSGVITDLAEFSERSSGASGKVVITVNRSDNSFIENHLFPYLGHAALSRESQVVEVRNALIIFGDWGTGHVMPEKGLIRYLLQSIDAIEGDDFEGFELSKLQILADVSVHLNLGDFKVQCSASAGVDFAFYLFKGSERIQTQPYGKGSSFCFEQYVSSGEYRVRVFARDRGSMRKRIFDTNVFSLSLAN